MPPKDTELNDLKIDIAVSTNGRHTKTWKNQQWLWTDLTERLRTPQVTHETYAEYLKMPKPRQDEIKDVGGFVGGYLQGGRRKPGCVLHRQLICLDEDEGGPDTWGELVMLQDFACAMYTTHKHCADAPRRRFVIPLDRPVDASEYQAISRYLAAYMGINRFDHTTFQPERLMYWPSVAKDGLFEYEQQDGPLLAADAVLATYRDWRDTSAWPISARERDVVLRGIRKQGDPLEKPGVVGAFCRSYTIHEAIEAFLADRYTTTDHDDRYTFTEGSTAGGLVVYEDKFAYSHHATDPAGQTLCNAFDLVRLHLFGLKDEDVKPGTPPGKYPSYSAMLDFARNLESVKRLMGVEQLQQAFEDFSAVDTETAEPIEITEENSAWTGELSRDKQGYAESTIDNIVLILENDPRLKGCLAFDEFAQRECIVGKLPWKQKAKDAQYFTDADESSLTHYLEKIYGISSGPKVQHALRITFTRKSFNPLRKYLQGLTWDGCERLDRLLVDYLGAEDSDYTRAVTRKTIVAAVARAYEPGIKFDTMLTIVGRQGSGKSTLVQKLSVHEEDWYTESVKITHDKNSEESVQGIWLAEVGELATMRKVDVDLIKSFLSKRFDRYRVAYGKRVESFPRQCVFIGTTNNRDFLKDPTGNRRFWVVDTAKGKATNSVFTELTPEVVGQVWAEAVDLYHQREPLYLDSELEAVAEAVRQEFTETDERVGMLERYLETLLPTKWPEMNVYSRREYLRDADDPEAVQEAGTVRRVIVCVAEIWCEVFNGQMKDLNKFTASDLHALMQKMGGWERSKGNRRFRLYGTQKAYLRAPKQRERCVNDVNDDRSRYANGVNGV